MKASSGYWAYNSHGPENLMPRIAAGAEGNLTGGLITTANDHPEDLGCVFSQS